MSAQLFSPGELAKPHAALEGLKQCTKCHEAGERLTDTLCLDCHDEIAKRDKAGVGYHGKTSVKDESCAKCHSDHQGRDYAMIQWGPGGQKGFEHDKTGWKLEGKHGKAKCSACHEARFIIEPAVKQLVAKTHRKTFLGVATECESCHFDEHRGQLEGSCDKCHDARAWKPAPGFDHGKNGDYKLTGKHAKVACKKCHDTTDDKKTPAEVFPAPVAKTFVKFTELPHEQCTDCHDDPHDNRFGASCSRCHSTKGWSALTSGAKDADFHKKTRFPLEGAHGGVDCKACHGPAGKKKAVYKGLEFDACTDCHYDAHLGQLGKLAAVKKGETCERCHTVDAFVPTTFDLQAHEKSKYPLEGAHRATACNECHTPIAGLAASVPAALKRQLAETKREPNVAEARFVFDKTDRCESCHDDPHAGQFKGRLAKEGCPSCHQVTSFAEVRFDHNDPAQASFALEGKHVEAACSACHAKVTTKKSSHVAYEDTPADCAACHDDVHLGQLADAKGGKTRCERCHDASSWKQVRFDHNDPAAARFGLEGKHAKAECTSCHAVVTIAPGVQTPKLKPLPVSCRGCHADFHQGELDDPALWRAMKLDPASYANGAPCDACHTNETFAAAHFTAHNATGFPLNGQHARASCEGCHLSGFATSVSTRCDDCHRDPHAGELGGTCEGCHDSGSWASRFDALAHARAGFPLVGQHGNLACEECHTAQLTGFGATPAGCFDCHADDYARASSASVDHQSAGFSKDCKRCHDTWRFSPAAFPGHDRCFQISRGEHFGIRCMDCHTSLAGTSANGTCSTNTASCTGCHEHGCGEMNEEHDDVPGYECRDRKCYECHRFAEDE